MNFLPSSPLKTIQDLALAADCQEQQVRLAALRSVITKRADKRLEDRAFSPYQPLK